jgi:hypothetical protein
MLLIITAAGILGSVVFGFRGFGEGAGGELYRILALGCSFAAAAAALGSWIDDGRRTKKTRVLTNDERLHLLVATPLALLMVGVFLVTLIPSIYVMLPFFAVWHYLGNAAPAPPTYQAEPAYAR